MYIILGEEQIALTLWYWRGVKTLVMYPIIIADIAPKIPGGLTHFNGPGRHEYKPLYRVYHKTYHRMVTYVQKGTQWKNGKCNIFVRINYIVEIMYQPGRHVKCVI